MFGRILLPFFALSLMGAASFAAGAPCEVCSVVKPDESFDALEKLAKASPENMGPSDLKDVPNFCRINGLRDYNFMASSVGESWAEENMWAGSFIAAKDRREKVFESDTSLEASLKTFTPQSPQEVAECHQAIADLKNSGFVEQGDEEKASLTQSAYLCKDITLADVSVCSKSLEKLIDLTKAYGDINLLDIWAEVFDDPTYFQVMYKVAVENMKRIKDGTIPKNRFFDDLNDAFYSLLRDREKSVDHTFKLLAVLASDGNNTYAYVPCGHQYGSDHFSQVVKALTVSSVVLDRSTAQKGFLYTYPKEVDSLCDYGKNYHFWMTAFLAREAAKDTGNIVASAAAAFTINKGYQFMATSGVRNRSFAFTQNSFSNYNNNMRLDLAQSSAGAWFGATSVKHLGAKKLTRDKFEVGLRKIFEGAQTATPQSSFQFPSSTEPLKVLSTYSAWKRIINPDAAYNFFKKEMGE